MRTVLRFIHAIGLVMGLGAATLLDLLILRFMIRWRVTHFHLHIVEFTTKVVTVGLVLMWASGIGLLLYYNLYDPTRLDNEKLWAKLAIVTVLTANGVYIHYVVVPTFKAAIGDHLFSHMTPVKRAGLLVSGVLSLVSWWLPFSLGIIPHLNHVPAWIILAVYVAVLASAFIVVQLLAHLLLVRTIWRIELEKHPGAEHAAE